MVNRELRRKRAVRLGSLFLVFACFCAPAGAADITVSISDSGFSPAVATMGVGDRLIVVNRTDKKQWIWGQGGNYAFDYRSTQENMWTHEPGQSLGIIIPFAGSFRIGNAFDGRMHATIVVGR